MTDNRKIPDPKQIVSAAWKEIEKTDAGQTIIRDLSEFTGEFKNPYVKGSFDHTSQKCGKLSVMFHIRKMLAMADKPLQKETIDERGE